MLLCMQGVEGLNIDPEYFRLFIPCVEDIKKSLGDDKIPEFLRLSSIVLSAQSYFPQLFREAELEFRLAAYRMDMIRFHPSVLESLNPEQTQKYVDMSLKVISQVMRNILVYQRAYKRTVGYFDNNEVLLDPWRGYLEGLVQEVKLYARTHNRWIKNNDSQGPAVKKLTPAFFSNRHVESVMDELKKHARLCFLVNNFGDADNHGFPDYSDI